MVPLTKRRIFKLFSSAVLIQASLSAANFLVGILLIRHTTDEQYGFYALAFSALTLLTSLQNAYIYPSAVIRLTSSNLADRSALVGGLYHAQRRFLPLGIAGVIVVSIALWALGALPVKPLLVIIATSIVSLATLHREFFRMALMAHRRADEVLKGDMVYVVLLIAGAALAAWSARLSSNIPAVVAVLSLGFAAWLGGMLQHRYMRRFEPWDRNASLQIVRDIVHIGGWGVGGAGIYWAATQGYSYIVAGSLGVAAVAALAGTRLIMMPVNLLSVGTVSIVAPTSSEWMRTRGPMLCFKRLLLVSLGMACIALCYVPFMWLLRNWIFGTVLHKVFPSRDNLILFWGAIFTVGGFRDQMGLYLMMRGRTRTLTLIAACSAAISLTATLAAMRLSGLPGALAGLLLGEITNALCTLWISWLDARKSQAEYAALPATAPG